MDFSLMLIEILISFVLFFAAFIGMFYPETVMHNTFQKKIRTLFLRTPFEWIYILAAFIFIIGTGVFLIKVVKIVNLIFVIKRVFLISVLFTAAYHDKKDMRIPNKLIIYSLTFRSLLIIFEFFLEKEIFREIVLSDLIAGAFLLIVLFVCSFVFKNGIGMGDVKLFTVIGLFQGITGAVSSVFTSLIVSFVFAVFLLITKKKEKKDFIAFAPCILCGTVLSILLTGA